MPSDQEVSRGRSQPSSGTITALMLTYRPIVFLIFIGPSLVLLLPFVSRLFGGIVGSITDQHSILAMCATAIFSKLLKTYVTKVAPTKEKGLKSLEEFRSSLLLMTSLASLLVIHFIVVPIEKLIGLRTILTWSPSMSFSLAFRLASGGFLLGLSVVARYIGPHSIVRCSSSPLLVNPYTRALRSILRSVESTFQSPQQICRPDDTRKSHLLKHRGVENPRRYQLPTSTSLSAQILISILAAVVVAFTSVLPFSYDESLGRRDPQIKMTLILACIVSTTIQLLLTTIHGTNHEIDPIQYRLDSITNQANLLQSLKSAGPIISVILVLTISVYIRNVSFHWNDAIVCCITVPTVIFLYLYFFDYILRTLMCKTPSNIKKLVEEASGGDVRMEVAADVILRSLLHSNDELVIEIGTISTSSSAWMDLEAEEQRRNNDGIRKMAQILLFKTSKDEVSPHLEDDLLRLAILNSLGGSTSKQTDSTRKYDRVESAFSETNGGGNSIDTYAVAIVRGLCVYAGGLGESIRLITDSEHAGSLEDTWVLPPGALFMGGCAIRGATRWILQSTNQQGKNNSLAILIPVLLNSTFRLQQGLVRFTQALGGPAAWNETNHFKLLQTVSPEILPLFKTCNDSVQDVIEAAKAKPGFRMLDSLESLDIDCKQWVRSKMME